MPTPLMYAQAFAESPTFAETLPIRMSLVLLVLVVAMGAARFYLGPKCSQQVAVVGSAMRANTIGAGSSGWIEVATKSSQHNTKNPAE